MAIILLASPLSKSSFASLVELRVPGMIIASTSPISSLGLIILIPTSSSNSKGSMSVKLEILGSLITPIIISLFSSNTWVVRDAESSSGSFNVSS